MSMSSGAPSTSTDQSSLQHKVQEWLLREGYPLEFKVANAFRRHGFRVRQGEYVLANPDMAPREIDVEAEIQHDTGKHLIRLTHFIECKWSRDKPWVIFTSPDSRIAGSACIAQTIGSKLAQTALWCAAGDERLQNLGLFEAPKQPGFGSRVALAAGQDTSYAAIQSVIENTVKSSYAYDAHGEGMRYVAIGIPTIVVDGSLFECRFDDATSSITTSSIDRCRLHYQGSRSWKLRATIDIVSAEKIEDFAASRATEVSKALPIIADTIRNIEAAIRTKDLTLLKIKSGGRGISGLPPLLRGLANKKSPSKAQKSRGSKTKR